MTTALSQQMFNLQSMLNMYLDADYTRVVWRDLRMWLEPLSEPLLAALREWRRRASSTLSATLRRRRKTTFAFTYTGTYRRSRNRRASMKMTNHRPTLDAGSPFCFHFQRHRPRTSEAER